MKIIKSEHFSKWYAKLDFTQRTQIDVRLTRILIDSNFGYFKKIRGIFELKFARGLRVYYALDGKNLVLLLCSGDKNTKANQGRDIQRAYNIYLEYRNGKQI